MNRSGLEADGDEAAPAGLGELARCLFRARGLLVASTAVGLVLAVGASALRSPGFRAEATILIEQESATGLLGDLAMLASLASAPATASELSVLESRSLASGVVAEARHPDGRWSSADERHLGLTTLVDDRALRPLPLLRRALFDPPPPDEPLVLPPRELRARATAVGAAAPTRVRVTFLGPDRVRVAATGWKALLGLAPEAREFALATGTTLDFHGLVLELEPSGDCAGASFTLEYLPFHEAVERLRERLEVREKGLNSGVLEVVLADSDPRRAARTVNALCGAYLESLAARGQRRASRTVTYVQELLAQEAQRFEEAQREMLRIQADAPELIAPEGAATSLIEQMATLEVERVRLELAEHSLREVVAALDAGDRDALARIDASVEGGVGIDPVTAGLLTEIARLEAESGSLGADLLAEHPLLERSESARTELVARARGLLASRMAGLGSIRAELENARESLHGRLGEMPEGLRRLAETRIDFEIHRELVPYLLKSLQGAEITRSSAETRAELVDAAVPPVELAEPALARWATLGALAGLAAGMVLAFTREHGRGRVHTPAELAEALRAETVVTLPRLPSGELVFRSQRAGRAAERLRELRGSLRFAPDGSTRRTIGVAALGAPPRGAGALGGRVAAELALAFAGEGRRTLLVDARPGASDAAARFGLEDGPGLGELLTEGGPWKELLHPGRGGDPDLLLAGRTGVPAGDLLARPALGALLADVAGAYDAVVLSLPPAERLAALPLLTRALDGLCLVHPARTSPRHDLADTARALRAAGARSLTGVLVDRTR